MLAEGTRVDAVADFVALLWEYLVHCCVVEGAQCASDANESCHHSWIEIRVRRLQYTHFYLLYLLIADPSADNPGIHLLRRGHIPWNALSVALLAFLTSFKWRDEAVTKYVILTHLDCPVSASG